MRRIPGPGGRRGALVGMLFIYIVVACPAMFFAELYLALITSPGPASQAIICCSLGVMSCEELLDGIFQTAVYQGAGLPVIAFRLAHGQGD